MNSVTLSLIVTLEPTADTPEQRQPFAQIRELQHNLQRSLVMSRHTYALDGQFTPRLLEEFYL